MAHLEFVEEIQKKILTLPLLDGWLIHDFEGRNRSILDLFGVPRDLCPSRRFFYLIPRRGSCVAFLHHVDEQLAEYFPGTLELYSSWKELQARLLTHLQGRGSLAMEDWSSELLPSQCVLDAETKLWLEANGKSIEPSWPIIEDLVGKFQATQKEQLHKAAAILDKAFLSAWKLIHDRFSQKKEITELEVQAYILRLIRGEGGTCTGKPIVAAGKNSAIPHHVSTKAILQPNEVVLIDAWCRLDEENAPYADYTSVAFTGKEVPLLVSNVFHVVQAAQKQAISFVETCYKNKCSITGAEVDDACRSVISASSFHGYFTHRTGHNIYLDVHGPGANLDNYETRDSRHLVEGACYSIEPGIYLPNEFGIRLECTMNLEHGKKITLFNQAPAKLLCLTG